MVEQKSESRSTELESNSRALDDYDPMQSEKFVLKSTKTGNKWK